MQLILPTLSKGHTMTSFTHSDFPTTHAGVDRIASALQSAQRIGKRLRSARGLVAMALAGAFSALVVVADQVVSSWADGQVVLAWIGLWVVLFGAVALLGLCTATFLPHGVTIIEDWQCLFGRSCRRHTAWSSYV